MKDHKAQVIVGHLAVLLLGLWFLLTGAHGLAHSTDEVLTSLIRALSGGLLCALTCESMSEWMAAWRQNEAAKNPE